MPRNPETSTGKKRVLVPAELIRPHVVDYCDKRQMGEVYMKRKSSVATSGVGGAINVDQRYSPMEALSFESGVSYPQVCNLYYGRSKFVEVESVDKYLTAMEKEYLWREDPEFQEFYEKIC